MHMIFLLLLLPHGFLQGFSYCSSSCSSTGVLHRNLEEDSSVCPLDMDGLRQIASKYATALRFTEIQDECRSILRFFRIVRSDYLRRTGYFTFSADESASCWNLYESLVSDYVKSFDVRATCGVQNQWISNSCLNLSTKSDFEALIPKSHLQEVTNFCNQSLDHDSSCAPCVASVSRIQSLYFESPEEADGASESDCAGFPVMYAAAFANRFGPFDLGTIQCLFSIFNTTDPRIVDLKGKRVDRGVMIGSVIAGLMVAILVMIWLLWRLLIKKCCAGTDHLDQFQNVSVNKELAPGFEILLISEGITLLRFGIDDLKLATGNFSREKIIGTGGYGNVYKGVLKDGSEVALKRFKNCSVSGDEIFAHEVQVIASVRHVNVVPLRGYCTATTDQEGHQRIIVCDYIRNGSLHDHLFGSINARPRLSWPIRRKIAIGIARGLAYLHNGVNPPIIHRDVKGSNVLLDEDFEPKLADFGLAKFTPDGFSHISTRVAGTLGYVCPEYALYGRLTEKSDVYSFGVVLLELLSGKKAVISFSNDRALLLTDVAWSLARRGRALDIIEEDLPEADATRVMEKYVLAAILCVHPHLQARPNMNQIVNLLDQSEIGLLSSSSWLPDSASSITEIGDVWRLLSFTNTNITFTSIDKHPSQRQDYSSGSRKSEEAAFRNTTYST